MYINLQYSIFIKQYHEENESRDFFKILIFTEKHALILEKAKLGLLNTIIT